MIAPQQTWTDVALQVRRMTDKLGMPVDAGIFDTVVALRLCGINTTGSCAGHLERRTYPHVAFRAQQTLALERKARDIGDPLNPSHQELRRQSSEINLLEVRKLLPYLDRFYENRMTAHTQRLVIKFFGPTTSLLLCQNAEILRVADEPTATDLLRQNQKEMQAFTDFLIASLAASASPRRARGETTN